MPIWHARVVSGTVSYHQLHRRGVNVSGFYALNGNSVLTGLADNKSTSICDMLIAVRDVNGKRPFVMIPDNASNNYSIFVVGKAEELEIEPVFLLPYRDFRIRWQRSHRWTESQVSDYLKTCLWRSLIAWH